MLDRIDERWGHIPLWVFEDHRVVPKIIAWRDSREATPRAADEGIRVLRALLTFGRRRGRIAYDATAGIGELGCTRDYADVFWSEEDIESFTRTAQELGKPIVADAVRLIAATGLGFQDAMAFSFVHASAYVIIKPDHGQRLRPRRKLSLPRLPVLEELLTELRTRMRKPGVETVLVDETGKSWRRSTLAKWVKIIRDAAGIAYIDEDTGLKREKRLHDLRRTFALRLMRAGVTDTSIASLMNWTPEDVHTLRIIGLGGNSG